MVQVSGNGPEGSQRTSSSDRVSPLSPLQPASAHLSPPAGGWLPLGAAGSDIVAPVELGRSLIAWSLLNEAEPSAAWLRRSQVSAEVRMRR